MPSGHNHAMVSWWRWLTLASLMLAGFGGCSGESGQSQKPTPSSAGKSGAAGSNTAADAGEGGADSGTAGRAGSSAAGLGGSSGSGGTESGARSGVGGSAGIAGFGGVGGVTMAGAGGSSGAPGKVPREWTCSSDKYGDGTSCDCGCGVSDPDCEDTRVESCDNCFQSGSCASWLCPSNVVADDNSQCTLPEEWACSPVYFGDGFCDCGCGVVDIDCESARAESCDRCPVLGCGRDACSNVDRNDNALCTSPPTAWTCNPRLYRDGMQCNCGCGYRDPDCSRDITDCDTCNDDGSCSGLACPGAIDPTKLEACIKLPAPDGWTCEEYQYGGNRQCDCGCGVQDADCRSNEISQCENCACNPERCPESLNPDDPTRCEPAPSGWICDSERYLDGICHCGCGVRDGDCDGVEAYYCEVCLGCADGLCNRIDPTDSSRCDFALPEGWTCARDVYNDEVCDCGCGEPDPDCPSLNKSACDFCNGEGSCASLPCADSANTILPTDNTSCSG